MPKEGQLHPTFPAYQRWVISKLVGIFATDDTNVLPYVVMRWIEQNREELKEYGISFEEWRKSQGPQGIVKELLASQEPGTAIVREGALAPRGSAE
jgi:hypothetical protein